MIRMQQENGIRRWPRACVVVVLLCLALLAILTLVQVFHIHQGESTADHCPICSIFHAVAPLSIAAAIVVMVQLGRSVSLMQSVRAGQAWPPNLFNRPPPARAAAASACWA